MVGRSEEGFRAFVASFADPLARLSFLLTAGTNVDTARAATDALARVRRGWREVQATGAPELLAIDALVAKLPREERPRRNRVTVTPSTAPSGVHAAGPRDRSDDPDDDARLRMILWELWQSLSPRGRLPLLLDDLSVAASRFAGTELAAFAGSSRRLGLDAKRATDEITTKLHAYPSAPTHARLLSEHQLTQVLRDALREHAATAPHQIDPVPLAERRARTLRWHGYATAAVVGGVVVIAALLALHVSDAKPAPSATWASASTFAGTADPSLLPAAVLDAETWLRAGGFAASTIVVPLWGGTDPSSTRVVVLGIDAAGLAHGLAVDWYHDPGRAGSIDPSLYFSAHYLISPGPPVPVAFPYATSRVGVVAAKDIVRADLVINGRADPPVALDASGFASFDATSGTGSDARGNMQVDLYDARGRLVRTLALATPAPE